MAKKHDIPLRSTTRLRYKPIPSFQQQQQQQAIPKSTTKKPPRLAPLLIGGALLYATATYVSMIVFKSKSDTTPSLPPSSSLVKNDENDEPVTPTNFDTSTIWESVAKKYDKEIGMDEKVMGIGLLRRWLIKQAKGDVLEVSSGTGRNFDYYQPEQIQTLTITDDHPTMLQQSQEKFKQYQDKFHKTFVEFKRANVDQLELMDNDDKDMINKKYDTVVDTFGLCSCRDPVKALVTMADACKSEESRILLLEHGRSHYQWLNRLLDKNVDQHVKKWGKNENISVERKRRKKNYRMRARARAREL
ncbi:hypothetical protein BJ944DRAFT_273905 [Cunninghamella echinulata]|nr:hypothetical protein BJ944DRAFT_273905 [Cunninghamella echinulata]